MKPFKESTHMPQASPALGSCSMLWAREAAKTTETGLQREDCSLTQSCKRELCHFPFPVPPAAQEEEEERGEDGV